MVHIGLKIRELMSKNKIDAPELAKRINKTKQAVYIMLEKEDINTAVLREIAKAFNVDLVYFFTDEENNQNNFDLNINEELIRLRAENDLLRELAGLKKKSDVG